MMRPSVISQKMGISFKHMTISASKWRELKPYGYKHTFKRSETEIAIAKIAKRKDIKVKPGYKKKMNAEIGNDQAQEKT
ncbi:MAG: hypothetical protein MZU79_06595 [Anaerotruncus sp.]|nr:hypothetical protein [Anaerotruncus sp.]